MNKAQQEDTVVPNCVKNYTSQALHLNLKKNKLVDMSEYGLTEVHIGRLAVGIPVNCVSKIGLTYLGLSHAAVVNIKADNQGDSEAQSREILRRWAYMNPDNQVQVRYSQFSDFSLLALMGKQVLVSDPGFSIREGKKNVLLGKIFAKYCMEIKEYGLRGGTHPYYSHGSDNGCDCCSYSE